LLKSQIGSACCQRKNVLGWISKLGGGYVNKSLRDEIARLEHQFRQEKILSALTQKWIIKLIKSKSDDEMAEFIGLIKARYFWFKRLLNEAEKTPNTATAPKNSESK
jgi:hypothetical protein